MKGGKPTRVLVGELRERPFPHTLLGAKESPAPFSIIEKKLVQNNIRQEALKVIFAAYQDWLDDSRFACSKGCSACCTENVMVTALEGKLVLSEIGRRSLQKWCLERIGRSGDSFCKQTMNEWAASCAAGDSTGGDLGVENPVSCPLLSDEACSVYEARPFACRCFVSFHPCTDNGTASQPPDLIAINTTVMQLIEHLGQGEVYGPLGKIVSFLIGNNGLGDRSEYQNLGNQPQGINSQGLRRAKPLSGLAIEEETQEAVHSFLDRLFREKVGDRTLQDIFNNG